MATEGQFPKADGDILYASEVNTFKMNNVAGITPTTYAGSYYWTSGALTNITDLNTTNFWMGSVITDGDIFITYPVAGYFSKAFVKVDFLGKESANNAAVNLYISGAYTAPLIIGSAITGGTGSLYSTFSIDHYQPVNILMLQLAGLQTGSFVYKVYNFGMI